MNDDMQQWLPVVEHLQNISLSGLLTFRTIIEAEIAMRQESFYNDDTKKHDVCSKKTRLEVVK